MSERVARRLVIHGHVQGVFYRESMRREAERLGLSGWVRNRGDGTVEAHVEGAPEAVEAIFAWAGRGPAEARVTRVDCAEAQATGREGFAKRPSE
jgi:acylphosphatase